MSIKHTIFNIVTPIIKKCISSLSVQRQVFLSSFLSKELIPITLVATDKGPIKFYCPNNICLWRARTLLSKEPETIEWINGFDKNCVFWDIGANVGSYSLYAGQRLNIEVFAFEPFSSNYNIINKNIMINGMDSKIRALCIAFSDKTRLSCFSISDIEVGSALHHFSNDITLRKEAPSESFKQGMIGLSIDDFVERFNAPFPNYVKIDVDGIESKIVSGARKTFSDKRLKSVLVELDSKQAKECEEVDIFLKKCGMRLSQKRHADMFDSGEFKSIYNYIYVRKDASLEDINAQRE